LSTLPFHAVRADARRGDGRYNAAREVVMARTDEQPRVCLVGNPHKSGVAAIFQQLKTWLRSQQVQLSASLSDDLTELLAREHDLIVVLGGDGTILAIAARMATHKTPIVGVNVGKLGYLAEFNAEELQQFWPQVLGDASLISPRMMLEIEVGAPDSPPLRRLAVNDCVIHAGHGFRMIEMALHLDGQHVTRISGDGLIISTPSGSTAHNMSAGGPILQPDVQATIVTPICPHSLTHRPVVVGPDAVVEVVVERSNEGTTAVVDGQPCSMLPAGSRVSARRASESFRLVRHPERPAWKTLIRKLRWGQNLTT
jgi:NAD+ kinase